MNEDTFRVLSLDGGGIRGVATAAYLADLESQVEAPLCRFTDLIIGTSTGGIIAAALARGVPAADIKRIYQENGRDIFTRRHSWLPKKAAGVIGALYESEPLHDLLKTVLGKDILVGDLSCRLCLPAFNITTGTTVIFKTRHHERYERDHKLPLWLVAAATAAAPIYFEPVHIPGHGYFVDGGIWANAPIVAGIAEGLDLGYRLDQIRVLSIGTGTERFGIDGSRRTLLPYRSWGLWGWGRQIVDLFMRPQAQRAVNTAAFLLPDRAHLRRIEFDLPPEGCDLDDVKMTNRLVHIAHHTARLSTRDVRHWFFDEQADPFHPIPLTTCV